jgi:vacuolar-type H+-ATPase subunit I/STV1
MELNDLIAAYKATRDERERVEAQYKEKLKGLQQQIEAALAANGLKSAKTEAGHAITSLRRTVRVVDWEAFAPFADEYPQVIKTSIDSGEALALIEDGVEIPGAEVNSTFVLTVK